MANLIYGPLDVTSGSIPGSFSAASPWSVITPVSPGGSYTPPSKTLGMTAAGSTVVAGPTSTDSALGGTTPGNMLIDCWFYVDFTTSNQIYAGAYLRMSSLSYSGNGYRFQISAGNVTGLGPTGGMSIEKGTGGSWTGITTAPIGAFAGGIGVAGGFVAGWYRLIATANGSTLSTQVQRGSDLKWLATDGTWVTTQGVNMTATDTTYAAGSAAYGFAVFYTTVANTGLGISQFAMYDQGAATFIINPSGIASAETFGATVIATSGGPHLISPSGIMTGEAFGSTVVVSTPAGSTIIYPAAIPSAEAFGATVVVFSSGSTNGDYFEAGYFEAGYFEPGYFSAYVASVTVPIEYLAQWVAQWLFVVVTGAVFRVSISRQDGGLVTAPDVSKLNFYVKDYNTKALLKTITPILEGDGTPQAIQTLSCRYPGALPRAAMLVELLGAIGPDPVGNETLVIGNE